MDGWWWAQRAPGLSPPSDLRLHLLSDTGPAGLSEPQFPSANGLRLPALQALWAVPGTRRGVGCRLHCCLSLCAALHPSVWAASQTHVEENHGGTRSWGPPCTCLAHLPVSPGQDRLVPPAPRAPRHQALCWALRVQPRSLPLRPRGPAPVPSAAPRPRWPHGTCSLPVLWAPATRS